MTSSTATFRRILAVVIALLAMSPAAAHACANADADPEALATRAAAATVLCLVNAERAEAGLKPLAPNRKLNRSARLYAGQMVSRGFFSHTGTQGEAPAARLSAYTRTIRGRWTVGENLAYGIHGVDETPRQTVVRWMNSPGHRTVILKPVFKSFGVGLAAGTPNGHHGTTYVTHFGS